MSLESKIDALTAAVVNLTTILQSTTIPAPTVAPAAVIPAPVTPAPVMPEASVPFIPQVPSTPAPLGAAPVIPAAPVMPAPPTFMAPPVTAPVTAAAPFSDGKGLVDYVMNKYKALGAEKGSMIQTVLGSLGYQNINDVKPEHYTALFAGVEALG